MLVYGQIIVTLVHEWWSNADYAHGLLTPLAVAYIAYERRRELSGLLAAPSVFGFVLVLASQVLLIVGVLGAEFFLQRISMLMFIAGIILFFWGWVALSKTAFGLVLLLLAIPLPAIIFNPVALPLQLLASSWATDVLQGLQVPVYREGNVLLIQRQLLNVTEACSGIRSLITLIALSTLTTMLARFLPMRWWQRIPFVLSSVLVAVVANAFRVTGTGLLANWLGAKAAEGFFHTFSGWLVFAFGYSMLLGELFVLKQLSTGGLGSGTPYPGHPLET
jgi:exosortase